MLGRKIERRKLEKGRRIDSMKVLCLVDLESVFSKGTLIASNTPKKEDYLIEEVNKPTPVPVRKEIKKDSKSNGKKSFGSEVEDFLSELLTDLFQKAGISRSEVDYIFAFSDFFSNIEKPDSILELIDRVLDFCIRELEGYPTKINLDRPLLAANELKAKTGMVGAKRIFNSRISDEPVPEAYLDISTYLSGLSQSPGDENISGLVTGLGLEIMDCLARTASGINSKYGTLLQLPQTDGKVYEDEANDLALRASKLIEVQRIPSKSGRIGKIPVNVNEAYDRKIKLIGCDVGRNGSELNKVSKIGQRAASYGLATLKKLIEIAFARMIGKIIKSMYEEELIDLKTRVCISCRQKISVEEFEPVISHLKQMGFKKIVRNLVLMKNPASFGLLGKKL